MRLPRILLLSVVALVVAGFAGYASLRARTDPAPATPTPAAPAKAAATVAKQEPAQDPRCANQDVDDDRQEARVGKKKPDTDDVELQCGDQDDDDDEVEDEDDKAEHRAEHEKTTAAKPAVKAEAAKPGRR